MTAFEIALNYQNPAEVCAVIGDIQGWSQQLNLDKKTAARNGFKVQNLTEKENRINDLVAKARQLGVSEEHITVSLSK